MRSKVTVIIEAGKIAVIALLISLIFIKIFHEGAVLPGIDENGETITHRFDYYFSIYTRMKREGSTFFPWVTVVALTACMALSVWHIVVRDNVKIATASHICFGVTVIVFLILYFIAASFVYNY